MTISRYILPVLMPVLGLGTIAVGTVSMAMPNPAQRTSETMILAQASASRATDCGQIKRFIDETSRPTEMPQLTNDPESIEETIAQIDVVITMVDRYSSQLQAMPLTDPQIRQLRTRYVSGFQDARQFLVSLRNAVAQENEAAYLQTMEKFLQALTTYEQLDKLLQQYCGFSLADSGQPSSPTPSPSRQQPSRRPSPQAQRPSSSTQRNAQTQQLNTQLQTAVEAKDWNRAIQIVDRLIAMHPQRASELQRYRARLVQLRNAQSSN